MKVNIDELTYDIDLVQWIQAIGADIQRDYDNMPPLKRFAVRQMAGQFEPDIVKRIAAYMVNLEKDPEAWRQFRPRKEADIVHELLALVQTTAAGLSMLVELTTHVQADANTAQDGQYPQLALARATLAGRQLYPPCECAGDATQSLGASADDDGDEQGPSA